MAIRIITNNVPRPIVNEYELTPAEREEFDYLDWDAIDAGSETASFIRYKGNLTALGDFSSGWGMGRGSGLPAELNGWDAYLSDSFFSGLVIKYANDPEYVIVGRFYAQSDVA